jgi:ABC-type dipeptide/oligopeptide/nickel transport system permease subunit
VIDIVLGIPYLLARRSCWPARLTAAGSDPGLLPVVLVLGRARLDPGRPVLRASVISAKQQDYVAAAGCSARATCASCAGTSCPTR